MKKKSYQKPLMVSEEFVPQEYVAACSPDISWQPKPNATPYSSDSHFWIDKNNNGILDTNEQIPLLFKSIQLQVCETTYLQSLKNIQE